MLSLLVLAGLAAGVLGLSPVLAGKSGSSTRFSSSLEAGVYVDVHGVAHRNADNKRADRIRNARCAAPGYRAANPSRCPALTPARARSERAQRARCARPAYRRTHPVLCPRLDPKRVDRALKRIMAVPSEIGAWTGQVQIDGLAINSILLPTGKVLWFAYPEKDTWYESRTGRPDEEVDWAEAYIFDPATNTSVRRDPPIDPGSGLPYNIWCAGQTLLRDGRVLVAGGNLDYYSATSPKYRGHNVVLTFNPFNETWTVQPPMAGGRWYPTLTELPDGRVVIVAGLDANGPTGPGSNDDVEVFTPSADLNGRGTIQKVTDRSFGLYPHMFLTPAGKLLIVGPDEGDGAILDPATWAFQETPDLPAFGPLGGRREWGAATLLPSGPAGPTTLLVNGGSPAEGANYNDAPATDTSLFVDLASGAISPAPAMKRARSHLNTTILPDGTLFTNGGGIGSDSDEGALYAKPVYTGELYNPATGTWTETDPQKDERTYHSTSLLLPDGRVISMGDDRKEHSDNRAFRTLEYYSPPYLHRGARPTITTAPAGTPYGVPVGIGTPDAIAKAVIIKLGATTHALDTDQRSLSLSFAAAPGGISVTMPTSANAAPPGYYQLFLLNGAGVPSVSKIIRIDTGLPVPSPIPVVAGPGGGAATPKRPAPKISRLKATVTFKKGFATVRLSFRASKAFKGTVKLFPLGKKIKGKAARKLITKAIVSKSVAGPGGRTVAAKIRFSVKGKRFPLKLRMTIALRDKRGGITRTITKGLLLKKSPKPTARILARAL